MAGVSPSQHYKPEPPFCANLPLLRTHGAIAYSPQRGIKMKSRSATFLLRSLNNQLYGADPAEVILVPGNV